MSVTSKLIHSLKGTAKVPRRHGKRGSRRRLSNSQLACELLEVRQLLTADFGDAASPYAVSLADDGPRHSMEANAPFLGSTVDTEADGTNSPLSNFDDLNGGLASDENGLYATDLQLTQGAEPRIRLRVSNPNTMNAILSGWIDYNRDGVFSNLTERASRTVSAGWADGPVSLLFPAVPESTTPGPIQMRFRISTDGAAAGPTGLATGGEVEDHRGVVVSRGDRVVNHTQTLSLPSGETMPVILNDRDEFGFSVTAAGDLNNDGIMDLAVGTPGDDTGGNSRGAVHVLLMNPDGSIGLTVKIAHLTNGGPSLADFQRFGESVTSIGDLDRNGVPDLAIGSPRLLAGGNEAGGVYVLFMNSDGTASQSVLLTPGAEVLPVASGANANFGYSVAPLGDLDGDGVPDLAVGVMDSLDAARSGSVWLVNLKTDGHAKSVRRIGHDAVAGLSLAGFDHFGSSVAALGDLNLDGTTDLIVGAFGDNSVVLEKGAAWVLFLAHDGRVISSRRLTEGSGFTGLKNIGRLGVSVANLGDLDGTGLPTVAIGASTDPFGVANRGSVQLAVLNRDGSILESRRLAHQENGGPSLGTDEQFGQSVAAIGDRNGDGIPDLAIGAPFTDADGIDRGRVWLVHLSPAVDYGDAPDETAAAVSGDYQTQAEHGGPSHRIDRRILLGNFIDGEAFAVPTVAATGDDLAGTPDDEDGLIDPVNDLRVEVGRQPTIRIRIRNLTEDDGWLHGWIDTNNNGQFEAAEQSSLLIPAGTAPGTVSLIMPVVPGVYTGDTYARFRISNDPFATTSIGPAVNGEVEDYRASIGLSRPRITSPSSAVYELRPEVRWARVPGAAQYEIWLRDATTEKRLFGELSIVTQGNTWKPPGPLSLNRSYEVWVRTTSVAGILSPWSAPHAFRLGAAPDVQIASNIAGPIIPFSVTHRATAAGYHYLIRDLQTNQDIINGRVWGQRNEQRITGDANIHARRLPIGRYRFWIRAEGIDGTFGNWSSGHNFVIGTGPSLNSGNTDTFDRRPLFTWNALPGATSYELTLINANNGQVVHAPTGIIGTGWSPVSNLTNGPYRVYTRAAGPGGFRTLASETSTFFVGGRPTVAFGMLGGKDGVPGLAFESVTGASRYHVQVDRVGGPVRVVYDLNVAVQPSQFSLGALAPGQYRAWVRAVSATGENSPWSLEVMFQITHNDNARDNNGDDDALLASLDILLPPNIRPTSALSASEVDRRASVSLAEDSADEITPPATTGTLPVPGPAFRAMIPTSEEAVEPADLLWPAVDWMFAVETRKGLLPWTDSAV